MKPIEQYPNPFPYGTATDPWTPARPHRGNDYPLRYEPVVVAGTVIAISGESGLARGPHTHVQAGRDEWAQQTINPTPYVGKPGTVVKTGTGSEWGIYVCVRVGDVNVFYCHLSKINVSVGLVIKEVPSVSPQEIAQYETFRELLDDVVFFGWIQRIPTRPERRARLGNLDANDHFNQIAKSKEATDRLTEMFVIFYIAFLGRSRDAVDIPKEILPRVQLIQNRQSTIFEQIVQLFSSEERKQYLAVSNGDIVDLKAGTYRFK